MFPTITKQPFVNQRAQQKAADGVLPRDADTAVKMDGVAGDRLRDLGGLDRARRNGTRAMTIIIGYRCRDRAIQQRAGAVGIDRHFRNGMLQRLKFGKRPPELLANAQVSRSEEHTSELQSLMRSSYAVF